MATIILTLAVVVSLVMKQAHHAAKELRALPENAGKKYSELLSVTIKEAWAMARAGTLDGMGGQKWVSKAEHKKAQPKAKKVRGPNKASKGKASRKSANFTPRPVESTKPEEASVSTPEERLNAAMACVLASPAAEDTPAVIPVVELGQPVDPVTKMEGQIAAGDIDAALRTLYGEVEKACAAPAPAPAPAKKGMTLEHVVKEFVDRAFNLRADACHGLEWYEADHPDESYDECVASYRHSLYFDERESLLLAKMEDYEGEAYCPNYYNGTCYDAVNIVHMFAEEHAVIWDVFDHAELLSDNITGDIHTYWNKFCDKICTIDWKLFHRFELSKNMVNSQPHLSDAQKAAGVVTERLYCTEVFDGHHITRYYTKRQLELTLGKQLIFDMLDAEAGRGWNCGDKEASVVKRIMDGAPSMFVDNVALAAMSYIEGPFRRYNNYDRYCICDNEFRVPYHYKGENHLTYGDYWELYQDFLDYVDRPSKRDTTVEPDATVHHSEGLHDNGFGRAMGEAVFDKQKRNHTLDNGRIHIIHG